MNAQVLVGVSALANGKWCVQAFEPLYIPFREYDHSCIKEYLVTVAVEVFENLSKLKILLQPISLNLRHFHNCFVTLIMYKRQRNFVFETMCRFLFRCSFLKCLLFAALTKPSFAHVQYCTRRSERPMVHNWTSRYLCYLPGLSAESIRILCCAWYCSSSD